MNKLIIIGNGFDLAHGLKTRYSDFILWYLNSAFNEFIQKQPYKDSLMEIKASNSYYPETFKTINEFLSYKKSHNLTIEYKFQLINRLIEDSNDKNWIDIESIYYNELLKIFKQYEIETENRTYLNGLLIKLNNCLEELKSKLSDYLLTVDANISKNEKIEYLIHNSLKPDNDITLDNNVLVLNFNYTSTFELYKDTLKLKRENLIYVHGQLNNDLNPIIFGYGDEMDSFYSKIEQLNNNEFLKHFKSFGYFKTDSYRKLNTFINSGYYKIYILGHSCGLSDRILLNSLFENKNCIDINILYHQKDKSNNDYFEKTLEISRHFSSNGKASMRNKIVPFDKSYPLLEYIENKHIK